MLVSRKYILMFAMINVLLSCKIAAKKSELNSITDGEPPKTSDTVISASEEAAILKAMQEARVRGMASVGLNPSSKKDLEKYQKDRVESCLANDVPRWSDLTIHYYCQHGLVRKCFTTQATSSASQFSDPEDHYRATFKHCENQAATDKEWQWLTSDADRVSVFKFVMFTNGRSAFNKTAEAFNQDDQDRVINKFYKVSDPKDKTECHKRPPRNKNQEPDPTDEHCGSALAGVANGNTSSPQSPVPTTPAPANPPQLPPAAATLTNQFGMEFVKIPAGTFTMGSPSSEPGRVGNETLHQVTLSKGFEMQTTEVTQGQYQEVLRINPASSKGRNKPVEMVSWYDAQAFILKLNNQNDGYIYDLPTEAQWEYAARAGTKGPGWGRFICGSKMFTESQPVKRQQPNAWGLYDMIGNVDEWTADWYGDYPAGAVTDPTGPSSGGAKNIKVNRGGSWGSMVEFCRYAYRGLTEPQGTDLGTGFRVMRTKS
jgi:formylglycine-generating enzyme required for sulfatase activity